MHHRSDRALRAEGRLDLDHLAHGRGCAGADWRLSRGLGVAQSARMSVGDWGNGSRPAGWLLFIYCPVVHNISYFVGAGGDCSYMVASMSRLVWLLKILSPGIASVYLVAKLNMTNSIYLHLARANIALGAVWRRNRLRILFIRIGRKAALAKPLWSQMFSTEQLYD